MRRFLPLIAAVTLDYARGAVKPVILIEGRPRTPGEEALLEHALELAPSRLRAARCTALASAEGTSALTASR